MPVPVHYQGDMLLAWLVFSDGQGTKRRPVLVAKDFGDDDLLVAPITSQPPRVTTDVALSDWQRAGLRLPSTVRVEKLATIAKSCVARKLGVLPSNELARVRETLGDSVQKDSWLMAAIHLRRKRGTRASSVL